MVEIDYTTLIVKVVVVFTVLYVVARVLNKKLISQMTFFDFVAGITLGSMTATIILTSNLTLMKGLTGLVLFGGLVLLVDYMTLNNFHLRKLFNSEPTVLMNNGHILEDGMKRVRFTVDELLSQLRKKNIFYLSEVDTAILETDGTVSVLKKSSMQSPTNNDLNVVKPSKKLPQTFIIQGKVLEDSLHAAGKGRNWLTETLKQKGIKDINDVIAAQVDGQGNVFLDTRQDHISFSGDE
ncbi:Uncharacterized membrane protein YcaP, DUF421 family [Thalassobacillus cyri]|uniref:Uncharacterized membrane protein YcaP, DUF421 family n=1 Tax=Thalassobacillus cyri TaxID=571932 RepID=A0A1H4EIA2_9BACI|nr:DUF421 domain-containing protein [Thalassobacillus cyri]SEA84676.1 Uncharacterized membrane protein YcaP, DUF421 family [Thalassobacillus cyri]